MQQQQACAVCRHQRKRCNAENCKLAPFFPSEKRKQFLAVHQIFGVSNMSKILRRLKTDEQRTIAVETLIWEAELRLVDPMFGSYGQYKKVSEELKMYKFREAQAQAQGAAAVMFEPHGLMGGTWSNNNSSNNNIINGGNYNVDYINNINGGFHPLMGIQGSPYVFSNAAAGPHVQGHGQQQVNGRRGRDINAYSTQDDYLTDQYIAGRVHQIEDQQ